MRPRILSGLLPMPALCLNLGESSPHPALGGAAANRSASQGLVGPNVRMTDQNSGVLQSDLEEKHTFCPPESAAMGTSAATRPGSPSVPSVALASCSVSSPAAVASSSDNAVILRSCMPLDPSSSTACCEKQRILALEWRVTAPRDGSSPPSLFLFDPPCWLSSFPTTNPTSVDFPEPFSPAIPTRSPGWITKSTSFNVNEVVLLAPGYENETCFNDTNAPGTRSGGGVEGIDMRTKGSIVGILISSPIELCLPGKSRLSLNCPPRRPTSIPVRSSSFLRREAACFNFLSSPVRFAARTFASLPVHSLRWC